MSERRRCPVVAYDPGGTTGLVAATVFRDTLFGDAPYEGINLLSYEQLDWTDEMRHALDIVALAMSVSSLTGERVALIGENFSLRKFSRSAELLSPVRIIELVRSECSRVDPDGKYIKRFYQSPSEAKGSVTDERLKAWGLYIKGKQHARDGLRHTVHFYKRSAKREAVRAEAWGMD